MQAPSCAPDGDQATDTAKHKEDPEVIGIPALEERIELARQRARQLLGASDAQVQEGLELHKEVMVVDTFCLAPSVMGPGGKKRLNEAIERGEDAAEVTEVSMDGSFGGVAFDREAWDVLRYLLDVTGVNIAFRNVSQHGGDTLKRVLRTFARFQVVCDSLPGQVVKVIRAADARRAFAEGKYGMLFSSNSPPAMGGFTDGHDLLDWLGVFHRLGYRMMHLTYDRRNWVADGCYERTDAGLSDFGCYVVERMNDLGIMADVAHAGVQTALDAARVSRAPIVASHTVCRALHEHPRGETDEALRAIAETGGFAGITCIPQFLAESGTIVDLLDHIDHAVNVMGIDHVTIGTDVGYGVELPDGPRGLPRPRGGRIGDAPPIRRPPVASMSGAPAAGPDESENRVGSLCWVAWPYFTVGLKMRGYSDEQVGKIIGGNALRVLEEVGAAAGQKPWA